MKTKKLIAVSVEHVRGWGRCVCEGIAAYAHAHPDWRLTMFEDGVPNAAVIRKFDGFLWCVADAEEAAALVATGKPVVDLVSDGVFPGTVSVGANHLACGQQAARFFITRHFRNFAFFGWRGLRFSDARQASYCRALKLSHYDCHVCLSRPQSMRQYVDSNVLRERLALPSDVRRIAGWIARLPKPVGVFCANDLRAWQLAEICRSEDVRIPDEVAILGADNDSVPCLFVSPTLSSIDTNTVETGRRAAEVLDELMTGRRSPDEGKVLVRPTGVITRESTAVYPVDPPWLAEVLTYIRANVNKALTANDIVKHVGRSYGAIENAFKRVLGTTVQKEIMSARLDAAEHLLKNTDLPILEIATRSGFGSQQYFNRCFSARHRLAPGEWRAIGRR